MVARGRQEAGKPESVASSDQQAWPRSLHRCHIYPNFALALACRKLEISAWRQGLSHSITCMTGMYRAGRKTTVVLKKFQSRLQYEVVWAKLIVATLRLYMCIIDLVTSIAGIYCREDHSQTWERIGNPQDVCNS